MLCRQLAHLTWVLPSHGQVDRVTLESVVNDWAGAVLRLVTLMPGHPAVQRDLPGMCAAGTICYHPLQSVRAPSGLFVT